MKYIVPKGTEVVRVDPSMPYPSAETLITLKDVMYSEKDIISTLNTTVCFSLPKDAAPWKHIIVRLSDLQEVYE